MRAGVTSIPAAARRARVAALGGSISTPRIASGSTTMVAPPAVVVTTPTLPAPARRRGSGTRRTSGRPSISPRGFPPARCRIRRGTRRRRRPRRRAHRCARPQARARRRAAELVGDHRLAALAAASAKRARLARGAWSRETAGSRRCRDHRACSSQISPSERSTSLPTETRPGEADAACLAAREQRADHASGVRGDEGAADRQFRLVEGRVRGQHRLAAQIDHAEARWPDERRPVRAQTSRSRSSRARRRRRLRQAVGQHGRDLHAEPPAILDRFDRGLGRRHHVDVVGRLGQRRERGPGALAEHRLAPWIDRDRRVPHSPSAAETFSGRPAVLPASSDWPTIATERGENNACWRSRRLSSAAATRRGSGRGRTRHRSCA